MPKLHKRQKTMDIEFERLEDDTGLFNPDETLQALIYDVEGNIWRKL